MVLVESQAFVGGDWMYGTNVFQRKYATFLLFLKARGKDFRLHPVRLSSGIHVIREIVPSLVFKAIFFSRRHVRLCTVPAAVISPINSIARSPTWFSEILHLFSSAWGVGFQLEAVLSYTWESSLAGLSTKVGGLHTTTEQGSIQFFPSIRSSNFSMAREIGPHRRLYCKISQEPSRLSMLHTWKSWYVLIEFTVPVLVPWKHLKHCTDNNTNSHKLSSNVSQQQSDHL